VAQKCFDNLLGIKTWILVNYGQLQKKTVNIIIEFLIES